MRDSLNKIISKFENKNELVLNNLGTAELCVFCAGVYGKNVAGYLLNNGIKIDYFCDNDSSKTDGTFLFKGIPWISFEELKKVKEEVVVLIATGAFKEVYDQLIDNGFKNVYNALEYKIRFSNFWNENEIEDFSKNIYQAYDSLQDEKSREVYEFCLNSWVEDVFSYDKIKTENQYFEKDLIKIKKDEVFVDVGAYDGDSFEVFVPNANDGFERYIAFELNHKNADKFNDRLKNYDTEIQEKVTIIEKGLSNTNTTITYSDDATASKISDDVSDENTLKGEIARLDDVLDEKITFLKMDIEGAELDALEGSRELIKKYKPTLAICVYHHPTHLWDVPNYIKSLVPEYKIYMRHYTSVDTETVCYAVIED